MAQSFCIHSRKLMDFIEENFNGISAPFNAGIELTTKCNLNCVHCYAKHDKYKDITTEEFKQVFDELVDRGLLEVYLTGGEIFLRRDFEELFVYAKKKGVLVVLLSNITMLSQKHIDLFSEYPVELISTTMYGYSEETYERVTQVKGSYRRFMNGLDLIRKNGIELELKFIGMKQNIEDLYKVREFGRQLGVDMVVSLDIHPTRSGSLEPMDYRLPPRVSYEFDVTDEGRREFWKAVARDLVSGEIGVRPQYAKARFEQGYLYPCSVAHQFVFISSDYQMQGCGRATYRKFDLRKGTFDEGWQYLKEQLKDKKASPDFKCMGCNIIRFCEQCNANFAQAYGDEEQVDPYYCELAALRKSFVDEEIKLLLSGSGG